MKYSFGILILLVLILSCGKINEKVAFDEIKKFEYTRNIDTQKLISFLNSNNPNIRLKAVEALGRIQDTSKVVLLANRLKDDDESVRKAAAFGLGLLFSPIAETYLIDAIKLDPSELIRLAMVDALGKSGTSKCFPILMDYLESDKRNYEEHSTIACGVLAYRGYPPLSNAFALEILLNAGKNEEVRWRSAYSLFRMASPFSFKNVYNEINYKVNALVRYFTLRALSLMLEIMENPEFQQYKNDPKIIDATKISKSSEFFDTIAKMLNDSTWYVRSAAAEMIGILGNRFFQDEIIAATKDKHPYVRSTALQTLTNFNSRTTRSELIKTYNSNIDWQLRGEALLTLAELDIRQSLVLIEADINNLDWPKNYYLIKALEKITDANYRSKSTQLLMQLVSDGDSAQKTIALEALVDRNEVPIEFMLQELEIADPAITTIIATHVAFKKSAQAIDPLIKAYNTFKAPEDLEAMNSVIIALDSIKSPQSIQFLEKELKNPYPPIQQNAQNALIHITGNSNIEIPETEQVYLTKWDFDLQEYSVNPRVNIETSKGDIILELFPNKAPVTVANFISLIQKGFYDSIYFHRVIPGFVIQGGDPRGDGWGGPGYSIPCEYNDTFFARGILGMAHAGKDTGGSQFFITQLPQPHLNGRYTAFGKVIEGMDVVDQIMLYDYIISCNVIN